MAFHLTVQVSIVLEYMDGGSLEDMINKVRKHEHSPNHLQYVYLVPATAIVHACGGRGSAHDSH